MIRTTITTTVAMALLLTVSFAYAETPSSVEVTSMPFDVAVLEGGSITFNNQGTSTWNFVSYGWFEHTVEPASSLTIDLPIISCGTTCFVADDYFIKDLATGEYSVLHIVEPVVVEPVYTPTITYGATVDTTTQSLSGYVETNTRTTIDAKIYSTDGYGYMYNPVDDISFGTTSTGGFSTSLATVIDKYQNSNLFKIELFHEGVMFDRVFYYENNQVLSDFGGEERFDLYTTPFDIGVKPNGFVGIWNTVDYPQNLQWIGGNHIGTIQSGEFILIGLPETQFPVNQYQIIDTTSGLISGVDVYSTQPPTIVIEDVSNEEPIVEIVEEVEVETEVIEQITITNSTSTQTIPTNTTTTTQPTSNEGIYNVPIYEGDYDSLTLQQQLAEITTDYLSALETIGVKNTQISSLESNVSTLQSSVNSLETSVSTLNEQKISLEANLHFANEDLTYYRDQVDQLSSDITALHLNSTVSTAYVEQLETDVATATVNIQSLETEMSALESDLSVATNSVSVLEMNKVELQNQLATVTAEKDQWKQLANSWYTIALEQLRVMVEVLGINS